MVYSASKYDHITLLLTHLHWLKVPERIEFKLAVLVYRWLHRNALTNYTICLVPRPISISTQPHHHRLLSDVPAFQPSATEHFQLWNTLPQNVTSASSLTVFRKRLTTHLFNCSFRQSSVVPVPWLLILDIIIDLFTHSLTSIAMLLLCNRLGAGKTAVGPCGSDRSWQMLPTVHRASVPRRDDVVQRAGDPAHESCEHCPLAESDGHQRPAVIRLYGCSADADAYLGDGTAAWLECTRRRGSSYASWSTGMLPQTYSIVCCGLGRMW